MQRHRCKQEPNRFKCRLSDLRGFQLPKHLTFKYKRDFSESFNAYIRSPVQACTCWTTVAPLKQFPLTSFLEFATHALSSHGELVCAGTPLLNTPAPPDFTPLPRYKVVKNVWTKTGKRERRWKRHTWTWARKCIERNKTRRFPHGNFISNYFCEL